MNRELHLQPVTLLTTTDSSPSFSTGIRYLNLWIILNPAWYMILNTHTYLRHSLI